MPKYTRYRTAEGKPAYRRNTSVAEDVADIAANVVTGSGLAGRAARAMRTKALDRMRRGQHTDHNN